MFKVMIARNCLPLKVGIYRFRKHKMNIRASRFIT